MPKIDLVNPQTPLGQRLAAAPGYPLRGAALAAIVALALAHYVLLVTHLSSIVPVPLVGLISTLIGWLLNLLVWAFTFAYALACLHHTANGYARPPELVADDNYGGWAVVVIMIAGILLVAFAEARLGTIGGGIAGLLVALVMPAIVMVLAFGDGFAIALNPATWASCMARIGAPYLLLVAVQLASYALQGQLGASINNALPLVLAIPVVHAIANYTIFLNFHLMGVLVHRYHEEFGLQPEAPQLMRASGHGVDAELIEHAKTLAAQGDTAAAIDLLRQRLRERKADTDVHLAYRRLLRGEGRNDELLSHAQPCIANMVADGEPHRALGVVQECIELKPKFMPNDPTLAGRLADTAAQAGMWQLALKLARGYPNTWPDAAGAPHYGLLAARILSEHMDKPAEAQVLAQKLADTFPRCVEHADIKALVIRLTDSQAAP